MSANIILNANDNITCPHCNSEFPLKDAVTKHLIEQHEGEYQQLLDKELAEIQRQATKDAEKSAAKSFKKQIDELQERLSESQENSKSLKKRIASERLKAEEVVRESLKLEQQALEESLKSKEQQLEQFRKQELELRRTKSELEDKQKNMELELSRQIESEKESLRLSIGDEFKLKEAELRKKIEDAAKANEDLKRKLEQGSQQLQGEVLELELENLLSADYPFDNIEAVKSGARGADIIQTVKMRSGTECGKIVLETKRTENWSNGWVSKLKTDMQNVNGDIGVIVTAAFPSDIKEPMVIKDGVWLVKPNLVRSLVEALRSSLLEVQRQKAISSGREQHLEAVYDYVCSIQFMQRIKAVVAHQQEMKKELDKERNALTRIWNKREKQISGITDQMVSMVGELQGLADDGMPLLDQIAELDE